MANLRLIEVRGVNTKDERVFMRAAEDLNLGNYIVTDTTYDENGNVSNKARHVYEFANKSIKQGEYVALYSKEGKYELTTVEDGTPLHRFYWGLGYTIWNDDGDKAWLLYAPAKERQSKTVAPAKK